MRAIDADLLKKEMWSDYYTNDMYYPNSHEDTLRIVSNIIDSLPTVEGKAHEQNPCDLQECEPPCGGKENCEFRGMDGFCKAHQGPRVMTAEEAQKLVEIPLESRDPVFYEDRTLERAWWIWNADDRRYLPAIIGGIGRFWTSRPTDEQREATPWN